MCHLQWALKLTGKVPLLHQFEFLPPKLRVGGKSDDQNWFHNHSEQTTLTSSAHFDFCVPFNRHQAFFLFLKKCLYSSDKCQIDFFLITNDHLRGVK